MTLETLNIRVLDERATIPTRSHATDAGLDIYASEDVVVTKGSLVPTGIAVDIPEGYEAQVRPRSGMSAKSPLRVTLGTVDSGFTGEIKVIADCYPVELEEDGELIPLRYNVISGEKIAQLVVSPIENPTVNVVDSFESDSARGSNGFGSSGN